MVVVHIGIQLSCLCDNHCAKRPKCFCCGQRMKRFICEYLVGRCMRRSRTTVLEGTSAGTFTGVSTIRWLEGDTWQRRRFNASLFRIDGNVPHRIAPWCKSQTMSQQTLCSLCIAVASMPTTWVVVCRCASCVVCSILFWYRLLLFVSSFCVVCPGNVNRAPIIERCMPFGFRTCIRTTKTHKPCCGSLYVKFGFYRCGQVQMRNGGTL